MSLVLSEAEWFQDRKLSPFLPFQLFQCIFKCIDISAGRECLVLILALTEVLLTLRAQSRLCMSFLVCPGASISSKLKPCRTP